MCIFTEDWEQNAVTRTQQTSCCITKRDCHLHVLTAQPALQPSSVSCTAGVPTAGSVSAKHLQAHSWPFVFKVSLAAYSSTDAQYAVVGIRVLVQGETPPYPR